MLSGDTNGMCHESFGFSRDAIVIKSRVGALEDRRFKRIKLDSILTKNPFRNNNTR